MGLVGNGWANCFRTHNELTMGLSGKYPLAPSGFKSPRPNPYARSPQRANHHDQYIPYTGGKGVFTQQAHGEFIVSSETICPPITHQAHGGYFSKEFLNSPTNYPPGTWWVLFKSAYDSTQWKWHGRNGWVLS